MLVTLYCPFTITREEECDVQLAVGRLVSYSRVKPVAFADQETIALRGFVEAKGRTAFDSEVPEFRALWHLRCPDREPSRLGGL